MTTTITLTKSFKLTQDATLMTHYVALIADATGRKQEHEQPHEGREILLWRG